MLADVGNIWPQKLLPGSIYKPQRAKLEKEFNITIPHDDFLGSSNTPSIPHKT